MINQRLNDSEFNEQFAGFNPFKPWENKELTKGKLLESFKIIVINLNNTNQQQNDIRPNRK